MKARLDCVGDLPPVFPNQEYIAALEAMNGAPPDPLAGGAAPIFIDLNSDGVSLIDASTSSVRFDLNRNVWRDALGWVAPNGALLGLDRDSKALTNMMS